MNCGIMPCAVSGDRLTEVEHLRGEVDLPLQGSLIQPNLTVSNAVAPIKRTRSGVLASRVDLPTAKLAQMKSLEASDPPAAEPVPGEKLSESANLFTEYSNVRPSHTSGPGSRSSAHGPLEEAVDYSMGPVIRRELACQQLDIRQRNPCLLVFSLGAFHTL